MGKSGELNVGQLIREHYGREAVLIGFSTYRGTVTAASDWDGPMERKAVLPAHAESYEAMFHEVGIPRFLLTLNDNSVADPLKEQRLERAIGVIYLPKTERLSHYFYVSLPAQFHAVLHFDETHALEPLDPPSNWPAGDGPDTFPSGM
jgi:erythromycin esterase-like protein